MFYKIRINQKLVAIFLMFTLSVGTYARHLIVNKGLDKLQYITNTVDAENLFKGIMFYSGEVANAIPIANYENEIISNLNPRLQKQYQVMQNQIVEVLKAKNPFYFEDFKNDVFLKNHDRLLRRLISASNDIKEVMIRIYGVDVSHNISLEELSKKIEYDSKYKDIIDENGHIDLNKINEVYSSENVMNEYREPEACIGLILIIVLVIAFVKVIEHNRSEVLTGNKIMLISNLESEVYINEIVNSIR